MLKTKNDFGSIILSGQQRQLLKMPCRELPLVLEKEEKLLQTALSIQEISLELQGRIDRALKLTRFYLRVFRQIQIRGNYSIYKRDNELSEINMEI